MARAQVAELDWDPTNEQECDLSLNPMISTGPKAKFGEVDNETLTLDVLAASSMLIKGALGQKLHLAKIGAKGAERSKVPHGEETLDKQVKVEADEKLPAKVDDFERPLKLEGEKLGAKIVRHESGANKGKIKGVENTQEHHILHQKLKGHEMWEKAGMDVEDGVNKMLLPNKKGAMEIDTTRTIHEGRHSQKVERELRESMNDALERGKAEGWTQEQYRSELLDIIQQEGYALRTGERQLNSVTRESLGIKKTEGK
jgi:hypothetical protein